MDEIGKLEEQLQDQLYLLETVFHSTPDILVFKDRNSVYRLVNSAFCTMIGKAEAEIIGKTDFDLFPREEAEMYRNDDARVMESGIPQFQDEKVTGVDGPRWVHVAKTPARNQEGMIIGVICAVRDITERKKHELCTKENENRFRIFFEQAAVGVAQIISATGQFVRINQKYCDIVGYTQEEMRQFTFQEITHPHDLQPALENMQRLISGEIEEISMEKRYFHKNGSIVWVSLTVSPMWMTGKMPDYHMAIVVDITKRKKAEEELCSAYELLEHRVKERTAELESTVKQLKQEMEEKGKVEQCLVESERKCRHIVNNVMVGISSTTLSGKVLFVNRAIVRMLGYDSEEELMSGSVLLRYRYPEQRERALYLLKTQDRLDNFEVDLLTKSGKVKHTIISAVLEGNVITTMIVDNTMRKYAERAYRESELRLRSVLDQLNEGVMVISPEKVIAYVNSTMEKMFGRSKQELIGRSPRILHVNDEHYGRFGDMVKKASMTSEVITLEFDSKRKNGDIFPTENVGTLMRDDKDKVIGVISVIRDITERRKNEAFIHAQRDMWIALSGVRKLEGALSLLLKLATSLDGIDCGGIYLVDRKSGGLDLVCESGLSSFFLDRVKHYERNTENVRIVMSGRPVYVAYAQLPIGKTEMENKEGLSSIAVIPILHHEKVIACMNIASRSLTSFSDNTKNSLETIASQMGSVIARLLAEDELKKAKGEIETWNRFLEKRVKEKTEELKKSQEQLMQSEKLAAMGEMAGGLAHELNSPLGGLLPMLEKYRDEAKTGSEEYEELSLMLKACEHMAKIVKDFGTFSREAKGEFYRLDLSEVIEDTLSFSASRIRQSGVSVVKGYGADLPMILGEKTELQQVVLNLISNALDAMPDKGELQIVTKYAPCPGYIAMEFRDSGLGIAEDKLGKIFDPFFTTKRPGKGTGLGLSVLYKIIEKHGGKVLVESEVGHGTKFSICFPAAE